MKTLQSWEDTLTYVNRLGVAHPTMPMGWRQQVLMSNVNLIEGLNDPATPQYPIHVRYSRRDDSFTVQNLTVKAIHR